MCQGGRCNEITQMRELTVREVTASTGARCGSALLNEAFKRYLQQKHPGYWDELKLSEPTQEFEVVRRTPTSHQGGRLVV